MVDLIARIRRLHARPDFWFRLDRASTWFWRIPVLMLRETGSIRERWRKAERRFHLWVWQPLPPPPRLT